MSDKFRELMQSAVHEAKGEHLFDAEEWRHFAQKLNYFACDLKEPSRYGGLAARIQELNGGTLGNRLYYCATPPTLVEPIIDGIGMSGLASEASGWARIIIEKPFGRDLASAQALSDTISMVFMEHQIYRIDHYLGKETVQNILVFRFGNALFEPVWNRNHIDYVEITAAETLGIGHRGGYYEEAGSLIPPHLHAPAIHYARHRRKAMRFLSEGSQTLVHHDCHPGNLFWHKSKPPGFLDWQLVRAGEGISDVAYFLATALTPEIRRLHEATLISMYIQILMNNGVVGIDLTSQLQRYRAHLIYPLEAMLVTLAIGGMMDLESNLELIRRTVAAVEDLDAFAVMQTCS